MESLHPRPFPVLALALVLLLPFVALGLSEENWNRAGNSFQAIEDTIVDFADCPERRVARAAEKACGCVDNAAECARGGDGEGYFRSAQSAAKRLEKLLKVARKKGIDTTRIESQLEEMRLSASRLLYEGIAKVKARPDFLTDDRVVRAAAKAEVMMDKAKAALDGKKPWLRSMKAYRKAFLGLFEYL